MELDVFLKERFNRLRHVIELRDKKVKNMEWQVIDCFEKGNLSAIKNLMDEKNNIMITNQQLSLFIKKWEDRVSSREDKFYTTV